MIGRRLRNLLVVSGLIGYTLVIVIPAAGLLVRAGANWKLGADGVFLSSRQWGLLFKTMGLALSASVAAMVLSLPGAYAVGRVGRAGRAPLLAGLIVLPLMVPPMIYTFGWQRVWGGHWFREWSPLLRCVWIWASWSWPIPAIILGSGWSRVGRDAYEAALLVTSGGSAFVRVVVPALGRHVLVSMVVLWVLLFGEYSVPHSNGVLVIASDLLDTARYSDMSQALVEVCRVSIPLVALMVGAIAVAGIWWPRSVIGGAEPGRMETAGSSWLVTGVVLFIVGVTAVLPIGVISWRASLVADLGDAVATYGHELLGTAAVCVGVGMVATVIGVSVAAMGWFGRVVVFTTVAAGLVPGAVVGQAVLAAYQPVGWLYEIGPLDDLGWWVYNHWPIVVMGLAGRFAWIGVLAGWLAFKTVPRDLSDQACIDGADALTAGVSLQLRQQWPTLLCGMLLAGAMSMADIAVVSIVSVPSPNMVSMILMEKFHRFETGMLAALSLWLVAAVVPGAVLAFVALRRRG